MKSIMWRRAPFAIAGCAALLGGCAKDHDYSEKPPYLGDITATDYGGDADDLLTAGLGKSGLSAAKAPLPAEPLHPTRGELRRLAIYENYRALLDMTAAGGYGTLYGPNVDKDGQVTAGEGKIAGTEYLAYSDDGTGTENVTLMVQVPAGFDRGAPCIVTATSSGSRGVYGAISTGEWGLKRGCAVAYTDKGTGAAPHDLQNDTVPLLDGTRQPGAAAGRTAQFRAALPASELSAFNAATPNRFAFKHAHSQRNSEKDWGRYTLQAIEFAFYVLNQQLGEAAPDGRKLRTFKPENTLVIASSVSNGGGAALAAAELDTGGLIDGVAVSEPQIVLPASLNVTVRRGAATVPVFGRSIYDYTTYANLYQLCATQAASLAGAPGAAFVVAKVAQNRCAALRAAGLLSADTVADQAEEALGKLRAYGWEAESDVLHPSLAAFEVASAVSVTFANALSRASVKDNLCGYSYGATAAAGEPIPLDGASLQTMSATGNGVPPSAGVQLINNQSRGGPARDAVSVSPSTGQPDYNLDGALCLRSLLGGTDQAARALQAGEAEVRRSGNLGGRPAIIVHGRDDALLPVNHTSRPYLALNRTVEGANSKLSYIEVTNAQHFDAFIGLPALLPGYDTRYVPLHVYLNRALDAVYAALKSGAKLPPSQVVHTVPRGGPTGAAPMLTAASLPAWSASPSAAAAITLTGSTVTIPN